MLKTCITCNREYKTFSKKQKYCSIKCRDNNSNYVNGMKGKPRPDLVEWNKKYKSKYAKEWWNNHLNKEKILERNKKVSVAQKGRPGFSGPANGMWKGGSSFDGYHYTFTRKLKKLIYIRDNYKCRICGCNLIKNKMFKATHHIDYNKNNSGIENLVLLCSKCHSRTNGNREYWVWYFNEYKYVELPYKQITKICCEI